MDETISQRQRMALGKLVNPGFPDRGLTLREVEDACGVSAATLSRFLRGKSVDSDTLDRIAKFVAGREGAQV